MKFFNFGFSGKERINLLRATNEVIKEGVFVGGTSVGNFEKEFSLLTGAESTVGCANGFDALKLSIRTLNLSPGAQIAVSAHTFFATWLAIIEEGFVPIGIDAQISNGQMDPKNLQKALDSNLRIEAVIYVHMHGIAGEIEEIAKLCDEKQLALIEDCAQAHGLRISGKHVGTFGDLGAFSFYPTKNMPAFGDSGCVISSQNYEQELRALGNYGWESGNRDKHLYRAFNSRLDTLQAAFLLISLKSLRINNQKRAKIASTYAGFLKGSSTITVLGKENDSVWHHFPILTEKRDQFIDFMESRGVPCQIYYKTPCHLQPIMKKLKLGIDYAEGDFPVAEKLSQEILSLPMHPWITKSEIKLIEKSLKEWCQIYG
jgi:dTDP-4-amino-4,6-dideoxygalactose transaminase